MDLGWEGGGGGGGGGGDDDDVVPVLAPPVGSKEYGGEYGAFA
jgi:hypothetical protein